MIVAAGAAHGESEENRTCGVDTIDGVFQEEFLDDESGFGVVAMVAIEAGGDFLFEGGVGQEVAGKLFDGELVERFV